MKTDREKGSETYDAASMESAWLIERGQAMNHDPLVWWCGEGVEGDWGEWTKDANEARRFASKEEAHEAIRRHFTSGFNGHPTALAVEHGWFPPREEVAKPDWVIQSERNNEIVYAATGIKRHAIRCGWAVMEIAGLHEDWTEETAAKYVGKPFWWLGWDQVGAIVAAEPQGQLLRVEIWA